jgi:SLT domain-containing protein
MMMMAMIRRRKRDKLTSKDKRYNSEMCTQSSRDCTQSSRDVYPIIKVQKIENQIKQEIKGFHDKKAKYRGKRNFG